MISLKKIKMFKAPEAKHRALEMEGVVWGERYTDYKHKQTGKVRLTLCGGEGGAKLY